MDAPRLGRWVGSRYPAASLGRVGPRRRPVWPGRRVRPHLLPTSPRRTGAGRGSFLVRPPPPACHSLPSVPRTLAAVRQDGQAVHVQGKGWWVPCVWIVWAGATRQESTRALTADGQSALVTLRRALDERARVVFRVRACVCVRVRACQPGLLKAASPALQACPPALPAWPSAWARRWWAARCPQRHQERRRGHRHSRTMTTTPAWPRPPAPARRPGRPGDGQIGWDTISTGR